MVQRTRCKEVRPGWPKTELGSDRSWHQNTHPVLRLINLRGCAPTSIVSLVSDTRAGENGAPCWMFQHIQYMQANARSSLLRNITWDRRDVLSRHPSPCMYTASRYIHSVDVDIRYVHRE